MRAGGSLGRVVGQSCPIANWLHICINNATKCEQKVQQQQQQQNNNKSTTTTAQQQQNNNSTTTYNYFTSCEFSYKFIFVFLELAAEMKKKLQNYALSP